MPINRCLSPLLLAVAIPHWRPPCARIMAPAFLSSNFSSTPLKRERHWEGEGWVQDESVHVEKGGLQSEQEKGKIKRQTGECEMCVFDSTCVRFSASLVPSGRLSPWAHWTVLSLSHPPTPSSSPLSSHWLFFSLSVSLSLPGSLKMCVSAYVWCSCLKMRRWILKSIKECELETK